MCEALTLSLIEYLRKTISSIKDHEATDKLNYKALKSKFLAA